MTITVEGLATWHGLTYEQIITVWDNCDWKRDAEFALREIMASNDATAEDRVGAFNLLDVAIKQGVFPADPTLPYASCRMLLAIANAKPPSWWRRIGLARRQQTLNARLTAARVLLTSMEIFNVQVRNDRGVTLQNSRASLAS